MNAQSAGQLTPVKLLTKHILTAAGTQSDSFDSRDFVGQLDGVIFTNSPNADGVSTIVFSWTTSSDNTTFVTYAGAPTPITVTAAAATNTCAIDTRATGVLRYIRTTATMSSATSTMTVAATARGIKQVQG